MSSILTEMLDSIDIDILRALQTDARLSTRQLAAKVHRSPTPVFERLKRLEAQGYITRYVACSTPTNSDVGLWYSAK